MSLGTVALLRAGAVGLLRRLQPPSKGDYLLARVRLPAKAVADAGEWVGWALCPPGCHSQRLLQPPCLLARIACRLPGRYGAAYPCFGLAAQQAGC